MTVHLPSRWALRASACLLVVCVLALTPAGHAQNAAVNFTSAQSVPLPPLNISGLPGNFETTLFPGCTNLFAGKFHRGSQMDFIGTCHPISFLPPVNTTLLNKRNGNFSEVEDTTLDNPANQYQVVLAVDLNGDGLQDLVVNSISNGGIAVQLSNGNGTFQTPKLYPSIVGNYAVAGDFEDNGRMDIAVISFTKLYILHNDGSGNLTESATYTLPPNSTINQFGAALSPILVAGDINGDHKTDLAVVFPGVSGTMVPYISQGNGKFTQGKTYSVGSSPTSVALGDFNNDSNADIALATSTGINILLGDSSGTFSSPKFTPYPSPAAIDKTGAHLVLADFDKDGKLDLAFTSSAGVVVFWGAGNGSFPSQAVYSAPPANALIATDISDNGNQDLVVDGEFGAMTILYNFGNRYFRAAPNTHSPNAAGVVAGDFNRDGKQDIAVVNTPTCKAPCNGSVTVFPGSGAAYFNPGKSYPIGMHGSAIAAGDLNGDGVLDLVVVDSTAGDDADVSILLGIKGGGFEPAHNLKLGSLSNQVFLVDMNHDGKLDLVEDGGVALGDGHGSFGNLTPFPDGIGFNGGLTQLAVGDLNNDGIADIAAVYNPPNNAPEIWSLLNNGKGDFTANSLTSLISSPTVDDLQAIVGVAIGKLHDNHADIVLANTVSVDNFPPAATAIILFGDGKGNFTFGKEVASPNSGGNGGAAVVGDFNRDGLNDIGILAGSDFSVILGPQLTQANAFSTTAGAAYFSGGMRSPISMAMADPTWLPAIHTASRGYTTFLCLQSRLPPSTSHRAERRRFLSGTRPGYGSPLPPRHTSRSGYPPTPALHSLPERLAPSAWNLIPKPAYFPAAPFPSAPMARR